MKNTEGAINNGQSRDTGNIGNTRRRKAKQKHIICVRHHYIQTHTINVNKTWALLQPEAKDEPDIVFMRKSQRTQHGTQNVKTYNRTTQKIVNIWATWTLPKQRWSQVLAKGKQFMFLIRHPSCYSYIQ